MTIKSRLCVLAASIVQSIFSALTNPAYQAIFPELVGTNRVMNAMSLNAIGMNVLQLIAPVVGGYLVDTIDFKAVYFIIGGLSLLATIVSGFIPATGSTPVRGRNVFADIVEGLKYTWNKREILLIITYTAICVIIVQPQITLTPVFALIYWSITPKQAHRARCSFVPLKPLFAADYAD